VESAFNNMDELLVILFVGILIGCAWLGGFLFSFLNAPLIGEIIVGIILGPPLLNVVPYVDAFSTLGTLGLMTLVFEGGMSVNLPELKTLGIRAFLMALLGTVTPLLIALGLFILLKFGTLAGLVAGVSLASTSIGMATRTLQQHKELNSPLGTLLSTAAMIDDILSLIFLAILTNIATSSAGFTLTAAQYVWIVAYPLLISLAVVVFAAFTTWFFHFIFPRIQNRILSRLQDNNSKATAESWIKVVLTSLMISYGLLLGVAAGELKTTYLLGVFAAGVSFSLIKECTELWDKVKVVTSWLVRLFFVYIGFLIPVQQLFQPLSIGYGLLLTIFAIFSKLICGLLAPQIRKDGWSVGWAMVARGELGFVMSSQALNNNLLNNESFAVIVWAILLSTFIAPFFFAFALKKRKASLYTFRVDDQEMNDVE